MPNKLLLGEVAI